MKHRKHVSTLKLAVLAAVLALLAIVPSAAVAAEADVDIPRTADGRPDLSGFYNVATLTPMSRPSKYGDELTITAEEAKAIEEHWAGNLAKDSAPSDGDREAPPEGGVDFFVPEFNGAAGGVGGYNAFFIDLGDSTFQIDGKYRTSILIDPPDGRFPSLTDAAKAKRQESAAFFHKNTGEAWWLDLEAGPYDDMEMRPLAERCLLGFGSTQGPPMLPVMYNNLKQIVQTPDHVVILVEMNHDARIIPIDNNHGSKDVRSWLGESVGHWEGDTLVVNTKNFRDQPGFSQGSKDMEVEERFSRIDADTLLYKFTVNDPSTWTAPFTGEYVWPRSDDKVYEYACHEGNYSFGNIMRGARLLEEEALAKQASDSTGRE